MRQIAVVLGEVAGKDGELADRLGLADRLVRVVDRPLELGVNDVVLAGIIPREIPQLFCSSPMRGTAPRRG